MANVNELGLTQEDLGLDYTNIPEERGEYTPPLQPGTYLFELPKDISSVWETITRKGKQKVQAVFNGSNALTAHLPGNEKRSFSAWINNHAFPRGEEKIEVSDMQYLLRVLDPAAAPKTNPQFVDVLSRHAGEKFKANVVWSAFCNEDKPAYYENAETGKPELVEGSKGCGTNYYQNAIPRNEDGLYEQNFKCDCGAVVRAFPKLRNFRSI